MKGEICNGLSKGEYPAQHEKIRSDALKKNYEYVNVVCRCEIRDTHDSVSIIDTLNNEVAKVKVENSVNLMLDYVMNPLY